MVRYNQRRSSKTPSHSAPWKPELNTITIEPPVSSNPLSWHGRHFTPVPVFLQVFNCRSVDHDVGLGYLCSIPKQTVFQYLVSGTNFLGQSCAKILVRSKWVDHTVSYWRNELVHDSLKVLNMEVEFRTGACKVLLLKFVGKIENIQGIRRYYMVLRSVSHKWGPE